MKAVVLAYHNIGCVGIEALLGNGFEIAAVFTHKDDPTRERLVRFGRGAGGVEGHPGLRAGRHQSSDLGAHDQSRCKPDIMFSFYYRNMVKPAILEIPPAGCLNLHGSLLPKYRGRCPINWVLVNGEKETGVTLHYMTPRPDDGDIVAQKKIAIADDDTAKTLFGKTAAGHGRAARRGSAAHQGAAPLRRDAAGRLQGHLFRRPPSGGRRNRLDAERPEIRNLVRAVTRPYPGRVQLRRRPQVPLLVRSLQFRTKPHSRPRRARSSRVDPLVGRLRHGCLRVDFGQPDDGVYMSGAQLARELNLVEGMKFGACASAPHPSRREEAC